MARTNSKTHLEALRKKQLELVEQIRKAEAKAHKQFQEQERRKAELAGRLVLMALAIKSSSPHAASLRDLLDKGLTRPADRALFDLPPLTKDSMPEKDGVIFIPSTAEI